MVDTSTEPDTTSVVEIEIVVPDAEEEPEAVDEEEPPKTDLISSIKKTACYGKCAVFEAKIYSNGRVVYEGKQYVEKLGQFEAFASDEWISRLQNKALELGILAMNSHYPEKANFIPDLPNTVTYLKSEGQEKTIVNNHNAPVSLSEYETFLLSLLEELEWKLLTN